MDKKKKKTSPAVIVFTVLGCLFYVGMLAMMFYSTEDSEYIYSCAAVGLLCIIIAAVIHHSNNKAEKIKVEEAKILKTKLLAVNGVDQTKKTGVISGAIAGGILAGGLGALIGAMTGSETSERVDNEFTFIIVYEDGTRKVENVKQKAQAKRFEYLISKLELDS